MRAVPCGIPSIIGGLCYNSWIRVLVARASAQGVPEWPHCEVAWTVRSCCFHIGHWFSRDTQARRKREDNIIELRKSKREENLQKRRQLVEGGRLRLSSSTAGPCL